MEADVAAYAQVKKADAEQTAADKQARAQVALAEADKQAKVQEAEGDQALQMVPVSVAREQANVEDARVTVKIRNLEGQSRQREHRPRTAGAACHDPGREGGEDRGGQGDGRGHVQGQPHGLGRSWSVGAGDILA